MEPMRKRSKMAKVTTTTLNDDVLMDLLARLPAKSTIRFRCVSKHWLSLTYNPYFIIRFMHLRNPPKQPHPRIAVIEDDHHRKSHYSTCGADAHRCNLRTLRLYSLDNDARTLTDTLPVKCFHHLLPNSINGVLCAKSMQGIIVFNPTTMESVTIPIPPDDKRDFYLGLGFHPSTREYTLVRVIPPGAWANIFLSTIEACTVGPSESGRTLDRLPYRFNSTNACVSGVMYWTAGSVDDQESIIAFDLSDKQFTVIKPPDSRIDSRKFHHNATHLHEWDGKLCFDRYHDSRVRGQEKLDVWVLTDCVGNAWVKMYSISFEAFMYSTPPDEPVFPIWFSEEKALFRVEMKLLFCYYFASKTWRFVDPFEWKPTTVVTAYVETFAPISSKEVAI